MRDDLGLHVLALDWSDVQSEGAKRREKSKKKVSKAKPSEEAARNGSLSYETIPIDPRSLNEAVHNWIASEEGEDVPVLFVALHACGSLTLDILRTLLSASKDASNPCRWKPVGALVVGCCYNLSTPEGK